MTAVDDIANRAERHALAASLNLPSPLRDYQWAGVSFLARSESALLADEMGLGKTVQAAIALRLALREDRADRALVIAPASLVRNWSRELEHWAPELVVRELEGDARNRAALFALPVQVLIGSYEQIRADGLQYASETDFSIVLLDEAQRIKNAESTTALACRLLTRRRAWALSGTPLENSPRDLEALFLFLRPGLITRHMGRREVHTRIAPHLLRRRKSEVLPELPPIIIQDVNLSLTPCQRSLYDELWFGRYEALQSGGADSANLLSLFTKLKQLCNFDPESGDSIKLDYLLTLLQETSAKREKIIVFSQYVSTLKWISKRLSVPHDLFTGENSMDEKSAAIRRFEEEPGPRALLVSIKAGGVGLNLQAATHVLLFDRWWNPAVEAQAIQRAHRFGRTIPLHVHRLIIDDSVEERIATILAEKEALFELYVNEAESTANRYPTRADLLRILGIAEQPVFPPVTS
jgi:SNF2 family DNA or RNA helicase